MWSAAPIEPPWLLEKKEQERKNQIYVNDVLENCGTWPQKRSSLPDVEYYGEMNMYPLNPLFERYTEDDISIYVGKLKKRDQRSTSLLRTIRI